MASLLLMLTLSAAAVASSTLAAELVPYQVVGDAIPRPLTAVSGDIERGRRVASGLELGNCLACHAMPISEEQFNGTLGPDLRGVASRLSSGQIRLRIVNPRLRNPQSVMPAYYRVEGLHRVRADVAGRPILSPAQIEDLIAFLGTLR